jgi:hypothetical protein
VKKKPKNHVPLALPEVERPPVEVTARETRNAPQATSALEAVGRAHEGLDGKRYLTSFAVHVYALPPKIGGAQEFVCLSQSAELAQLPEAIALHALKELGRALMKRYGRKPPRKLNDVAEGEARNV